MTANRDRFKNVVSEPHLLTGAHGIASPTRLLALLVPYPAQPMTMCSISSSF